MQFGRNSIGLHQNCMQKITVNIVLGTVPGYSGFQIPESPSTSSALTNHSDASRNTQLPYCVGRMCVEIYNV